jgi:hypothetical protein
MEPLDQECDVVGILIHCGALQQQQDVTGKNMYTQDVYMMDQTEGALVHVCIGSKLSSGKVR